MSHYKTLVIIPGDTKEENIIEEVEKRLSKYDESAVVDPYKRYMETFRLEMMAKSFGTSDLAVLAKEMKNWNGKEGGVDDQGLYYWTTYNPDSKWDWWSIGGRWDGVWTDDEESGLGNVLRVSDLPPRWETYAIVDKAGGWHARAEMKIFGISINEQERNRWDAEQSEVMSGHANDLVVLCDLHI